MPRLLLITLEYPPKHGGVASYLHELVENRGDTTEVFVLTHNDFFTHLPLGWIKCIPKVFRVCREFRPDVIEISHILPIGYIAYLCKIIFKIPYVIYVHGLDVQRVVKGKSALKLFFMRIVACNAEKIIANSNYTKQIIQKQSPTSLVEVRYPRITPLSQEEKERIKEEGKQLRSELHLEDKKVILSVGRLIQRKGFDTIIACMPLLDKEYVCCVVGDGPMRDTLESLARKYSVEDRVLFLGSVPNTLMCMAMADVFVMPCRELSNGDVEGFGMVFLEADMCGTPVIGGNSGGAPEAVRMTKRGVVVDPYNKERIVGAIRKIVEEK